MNHLHERSMHQKFAPREITPSGEMADWEIENDDQGVPTRSSEDQSQTEDVCRDEFEKWLDAGGSLDRES